MSTDAGVVSLHQHKLLNKDCEDETLAKIHAITAKSKAQEIVPVTKAVNFYKYIKENLEYSLESDAEVLVGGEVIKCQLCILKLYSRYVRKLRPQRKHFELPSDRVTPEAMKCIYDWMCMRNYMLKRDTMLEVHSAAKFLEIDSLIAQSWNCIASPIITEDRAFMLYLEAVFLDLPAVQCIMITRIKKFFLTLVGFVQFINLPFAHVCEIISSDSLGVNSELEVFFSCVRYLNSNWEDRKERAFEMLKNVRFGLLPPHILVSFRYRKASPEINRVLESDQVEKLLSQTMHFSIGLGTPPAKSVLFREREWIYDIDCDYHATKNYPGKKKLTYETFQNYVKSLARSETHWIRYERAQDVERAIELLE